MTKHLLQISLLLGFQFLYSQSDIDTTEVKSYRTEWKINHKVKDTSKLITLTEYNSGLFKEIFYLNDNQPSTITISKNKRTPTTVENDENFLVHGIGYNREPMIIRNYLNKKGVIDSTYISSKREGFKDSLYIAEKKKNIFGKIKRIKTWEGKSTYNYSIFGNLRKVSFESDNHTQVRYYKNNRLVKKELGKKHKRIKSYEYNQRGYLKKAYLNEREFETFEYDNLNNLKIKKKFIVSKSGKERLIEQTKFKYTNDLLMRTDTYSRKNELKFSSIYEYKNSL